MSKAKYNVAAEEIGLQTRPRLQSDTDLNQDPGMIQDVETRRILKRMDKSLKKTKTKIWISFFLEFLVLIAIIVAWAMLDNIEP